MKVRYAAILLAALTACSHGSGASSGSSPAASVSPAPAATNPVAFPLYTGSTIMTTRTLSGSYTGHEVIAQTTATLPQLEQWIDALDHTPPTGYTVTLQGSALSEARLRARALGLAFGSFEKAIDGKHHTVIVIAIDPAQLDAKAGSFISLIGKYKMLPSAFRAPIDAQAKARTGFTVGEALDPSTPIGAALGALSALRSSGERGVVLLDANKE